MANNKPGREIVGRAAVETSALQIVVAWAVVGLPLAWGVFSTLKKAAQLFQ